VDLGQVRHLGLLGAVEIVERLHRPSAIALALPLLVLGHPFTSQPPALVLLPRELLQP